jgi:hypothetical protein
MAGEMTKERAALIAMMHEDAQRLLDMRVRLLRIAASLEDQTNGVVALELRALADPAGRGE